MSHQGFCVAKIVGDVGDLKGVEKAECRGTTAQVHGHKCAATLERDGVESFAASFRNVLATLEAKRATL